MRERERKDSVGRERGSVTAAVAAQLRTIGLQYMSSVDKSVKCQTACFEKKIRLKFHKEIDELF